MAKRKRQKNLGPSAIANIKASSNNTIISFTDILGNTICWHSGGKSGFKGGRKKTPYVAELAIKNSGLLAVELGIKNIKVILKGYGKAKRNSVNILKSVGLNIMAIDDKTTYPHNGCRPPKRRRRRKKPFKK
jgi:small subunit ribosomal protein S11